MKWFKHISDSLDDPFIFDLLQRFGPDGYLVFFGIIEIYSREFQTKDDWKLSITRGYLKRKLCKRQDTLVMKSLEHIKNSGKWDVEIKGNDISIFIPKFKSLLDDSTLKKLREHEKSFRNDSGILPKVAPTDKEEDKDREEEREEDSPPFESVMEEEKPKKRFTPPSIDDVKAYCLERKNGINAQAWIDHYTSNGWMVGKNHMKDWKAAVRTWEAREKEIGGNGKRPTIITKAPTPYKTCPKCGEEYLESDMIVIDGVKRCPKCPQSREAAAGLARAGFEKIVAGIGAQR